MRKDNGITVYEETDKCALDEYSEQLAKDIEQKFKDEAYDDTEIKQDISNIQAEQETQNINIKSLQKENAEIKEENKRLKEDLNAFPTVNGSGEYVTLDTADSRFKKFKIIGKSVQETREGYNLLNVPAEYTVLSTEVVKKVPISLKANHTYTIKIGQINTDNTDVTSVLFRFIYNEVDISNSYVFVKLSDLKTVYTPASDVDDIWIYSGDSYAQGAKTNTTYKNLMIYEGTDDKPYEPYTGGIPSPDYPSEIEAVGNNGNLYDKENPNVLDTPIDINGLGGNVKNTYKTVWIPCKPNTTYTVSKKYDATKNRFALAYTSEEPNYSQQVEGYVSNAYTNVMTITTNSTAKYLIAYVWIAGGSNTYQEMLDSIKIEKGTQATADNGHGLGSMEIIICNKNILNQDLELFQGNYDNNGNVITNSDRRIDKYIFLAKGNYILWSTINNWINVLIYDKNKKLLSIKNSNTNKEIAFTLDEDGYIRFGFNPTVESLKVFQLERNTEKTTSEEHKQQIIVFPFKKGQRLMEGDYLAEDGIHHKRKQTVLDGTENWDTLAAQKGNNTSFFYYIKPDMKKASSIICNQFINRTVWSTDVEGIQSITNNAIKLRINTSRASTVSELKALLAAQKEAGTPVTIEYELAEEEVETYTDEQKEAWKQIKNTRSYEGQTNIFSTDKISPILEVTARRNLNSLFAGGDS